MRLLYRDRRVLGNQLREPTADRRDTEGPRCDVEQQWPVVVADQRTALDGCAERHHLVGIEALAGGLAEKCLDLLLDQRHSSLTTHEDDLVHLFEVQARVLRSRPADADRPFHEVRDQLFELPLGQFVLQMDRDVVLAGDERKRHLQRTLEAQLALGVLGGFLEALQRDLVLPQVDPMLPQESLGKVVDDAVVEVDATEEGVPRRGEDLVHALVHGHHADVEGSAAEVVHGDVAAPLAFESVG